MRLSGKQLQQVQEALLDAYPTVDELRMLVRFELNEHLAVIAGGDNLRVVTFNLVTWGEQHGRLADLIAGACSQRPGNPLLATLQNDARQWFAAASSAQSPAVETAQPVHGSTKAPLRTPPLDIEWIAIPAGAFLMGSDKSKDEQAYDDETLQHRVHLPEYHIARHPITNAQYLQFVQATSHRAPSHWADGMIKAGEEHHPVVNVSWHDARAWCAWASKASGRSIRLPSEAEWEKASRGTDGRIHPWGYEPPDTSRCNFKNNVRDTMPVGTYPDGVSPYGVLDMAGNAWEWTSSQWRTYPYDASDGREEVGGQEDSTRRVLRGGSYGSQAEDVRCACRNRHYPKGRSGYIGFRVVASPFTSGL